jgi:UDP-glucose 4-epimerase
MIIKQIPKRVVIIGSKGFIGSTISKLLEKSNIPILNLSRKEVDLNKKEASKKLDKLITKEDCVIISAAEAPVKNNQMLLNNIKMIANIIDVIKKKSVKRVVYISSDAVYSDSKNDLHEKSSVEPQSLHGIMHLAREIMLKQLNEIQLSIIRPTLIYGIEDPHNGYGPNQFFRLASSNKDIILFGKGEELRDHVSIADVARITVDVALSNFEGVLNIASGEVKSFKYIASIIKKLYKNQTNIIETDRIGEMPHKGYRSFNIDKLYCLFPVYKVKNIDDGLIDYFNNIN